MHLTHSDIAQAICIGLVWVLGVLILTLTRHYPATMPLGATCSAVISAACHQPLPEDEKAYMFPVKWGVVGASQNVIEDQDTDYDGATFPHCSFTTARDVRPPIPGQIYI